MLNCDEEKSPGRLKVVRGGAGEPTDGAQLLTLEEVQRLLKMGRTYVLGLRDKGLLRCIRMPGSRSIRFRQADVVAFIARAAQGAMGDEG